MSKGYGITSVAIRARRLGATLKTLGIKSGRLAGTCAGELRNRDSCRVPIPEFIVYSTEGPTYTCAMRDGHGDGVVQHGIRDLCAGMRMNHDI